MTVHPLWRPYAAGANATRQLQRIAYRQNEPGELSSHRVSWASDYETIFQLIRRTIPDQILAVSHVGSTAVPGLAAKPVIDVDLTVLDVNDEPSYLPRLEAASFRLIFRDSVAGDAHRHLTFASPNTNLHMWSPHAVEPQRHELFTSWLRANDQDRQRYAEAKFAAIGAVGSGRYNDLKSAVVYDIYEHIFAADPVHPHDPQPRT